MRNTACESCRLRMYAAKNPDGILARLWRWHTGWCPGWKAWQETSKKHEEERGSGDPPKP